MTSNFSLDHQQESHPTNPECWVFLSFLKASPTYVLGYFFKNTVTFEPNLPEPVQYDVQYHINTSLPPQKLAVTWKKFKEILNQVFVDNCWSSPFHTVPEPNGKWTACDDYRRFHTDTPFHLSTTFHTLSKVTVFSRPWTRRTIESLQLPETFRKRQYAYHSDYSSSLG